MRHLLCRPGPYALLLAGVLAACLPQQRRPLVTDVPPQAAEVTRTDLLLRAGPGPGYAPVARVPAGVPVLILGREGPYVAVRVGAVRGWADTGTLTGRPGAVPAPRTAVARRPVPTGPVRTGRGRTFESLAPVVTRPAKPTGTGSGSGSGSGSPTTPVSSTPPPETQTAEAPEGEISDLIAPCSVDCGEPSGAGEVVAPPR